MKTGFIITLVVAGLIGVTGVTSYVSAYNYGVEAETNIKGTYQNMENVLAQYGLKIQEMVQVPNMKVEDLQKVLKEAMTGRYGNDGSKAVLQFITENYPGQIDNGLYEKIQTAIEAGRNKFENEQTIFIDKKMSYEKNLGYLWRGMWMRLAGYPKINLDDYKIISSTKAKQTFETGVDTPLQLR